ncbi:helix-turn-helix domain-containing protein [Lactobacillus sp. PV037]|uniref:helix-turn-helix domain-containing protein n=1 Tax=unclassified Lactobacillus TaxID=2620435 RepID=UPI00223FC0DF|nr:MULTISPECIES: RodZ domain-containing protein [unclassified Lactobacillus]QNQ82575.1 helix-turn-helix domain-containing protein [Lactobacillus sp. PV012]QNQ83310.1 helix-turn-helix domain-containing protein [Lactobacillus sp. PV037]
MADIGDKLKKARKDKGMSVEDVEKITKIQRRYLTAIENNEFDQLPGDFYVRAFIRQYADVVGLNGKELLEDFQSEVPQAKPEEYVENSIDNKSEEIKKTTNSKKGKWQGYLPKIATVIGVLVIILIVYLVYAHFFSGSNQQSATDQQDNVTVSSTSSSKSSVKKSSVKPSVATGVKVTKIGDNSYRVTGLKTNRTLKLATTTATVWAQVSANDNAIWQGTLTANQKHTLKLGENVKNVSINLGNTQTTTLTIGGKTVPFTKSNRPLTVKLVFGNAKATSSSSSATQSSTQSTTQSSSQAATSQVVTSGSTTTTNNQNTTRVNGGQNN